MLQGIVWGRHPSSAFPSRSRSRSRADGQKIILVSSSVNQVTYFSIFSKLPSIHALLVAQNKHEIQNYPVFDSVSVSKWTQAQWLTIIPIVTYRTLWSNTRQCHYQPKNHFRLGTIAETEPRWNKPPFTKRISRKFLEPDISRMLIRYLLVQNTWVTLSEN